MTSRSGAVAAPAPVPDRFHPLLLLLFFGSGCAALIYEIVWFEMLGLIVGSSAISMGVILATFMGGMCIGSLYLSRYVTRQHHPLRVYAMLEAGIGVCGLLVLLLLPHVGGLYTALGGPGFVGLLWRGVFCAICLLPPTLLMGATLPAVARWVETTPQGVSWLGFFYFGNTMGAVVGCLVAGFYLLRVGDVAVATFVAVALNFAVAGAGWLLSQATPYTPTEGITPPRAGETAIPPGAWPVLVTVALSGLTALGAEVVWTRLLSLLLGATVYTFSLILAAFLLGLGLGSGVGSFFARSVTNPRAALGWCQLLLMAGLAWAAYSLTQALPNWPINPGLFVSPIYELQIDFARCLWTVLPAACLWGASFPLALAGVAAKKQDPGRLVGAVYAANTAGAIVGAILTSLVLVGWLGTQQTQRVLIGLVAVSAMLVLVPVVTDDKGTLQFKPASAIWLVLILGVSAPLAYSVHRVPGLLVGYGRYAVTWMHDHGEFIYVGEGMNSSMAVSRLSNGVLNYHNAGKVQASSEIQDMRLQRMLGHLTTLVPTHATSVLVIGCGAGVTAGAVSIDPAVQRETIAEIEPLVPDVVSHYFAEHNYDVVNNPKVHIQIDDARHFLLTTNEKFDAITSDPFDPWVKGAATLYTKEFFEVVKQHLNPGGVMTVFVQLYDGDINVAKSQIATFLSAFPKGIIFGNTENGAGYDLVLLGQAEGLPIDVDAIAAKLQRPEYLLIAQSLRDIGFNSTLDLFGTYSGRLPELQPWLKDAQLNTDRNLRLQYLAGLSLNQFEQDRIYKEILKYRTYPDNLFTGSPQTLMTLRSLIAMAPGR
jgi:spermidine synthase